MRKSTTSRTGAWHVHLARLLEPLKPYQREDIRAAFGEKHRARADRLIADWVRVSEVAHQQALKGHERPLYAALRSSLPVRKRRDVQLRRATAAADEAIVAIEEFVDLWGKHIPSRQFDYLTDLEQWATDVTSELIRQRSSVERFRVDAKEWQHIPKTRGAPKTPTTYLLEVLVAYFRHHGWPHSMSENGLFVRVACAALGTESIYSPLRRSLTASRLNYAALAETAPSIAPSGRILHAVTARKKVRPRGRRPDFLSKPRM